MICASCGFENPDGFHFCGRCGATLARRCPSCGAEATEGFRFCGVCGTALDELPVPAHAPRASERRPVTVLFADLVGFSTLAEHLDPEELRNLMSETFGELSAEVERREGQVEKFIGDAVVAIFGSPRAHEDDPQRAVETALVMLDLVRRRSEGAPTPLHLRIGINSGLVVSGTVGDGTQTGVMGDAVNVAARLQQAAAPDEILVSASVFRRVRDRYDAQPLARLEVKGREQTVEAYRIGAARPQSARRQAPFVGRREERALLDLLWSSAEKGNTHLVSVVGEPGVGKSRLLAEFAPSARDVRVVCGGDRAFGPFLEVVERLLGGAPEDAEDVLARARELGIDEGTAMLLAALLGLAGAPPSVRMGDEQQKRQVFAGVWQFLVSTARREPVLVVIDDLHWADRSSLDLLGFLLERLGGAPLMLVLAYRPGFDVIERATLHASHTAIRLEPLSREESLALARGFLGVATLPPDLERIVATRAEGNPFFIEELLQALLELGSLAVVEGNAVLARLDVEIPDTVQGTILARMDRLDAENRSLVQHAAVLGRTFSARVLSDMTSRQDIAARLNTLAHAQLMVSIGPDDWAFKHALIQEVAYETLLVRQRRELHRKAADALKESVGDNPTLLEALSEHYEQAGEIELARSYGIQAGDVAAQRLGFVQAAERYRRSLRLWEGEDDEGRLEVLEKLGRTSLMGGDIAIARSALTEAEAGWRARGDLRQAASPLVSLIRTHWVAGDPSRAGQALAEAIRILEPLGPSPDLVHAFIWGSTLKMLEGNIDESVDLAERGLRLADELGLDAARANLLNTLGVCESRRGRRSGIDRLEQALQLAARTGDAEAIGRAYVNLPSTLAADFDEHHRAVEISREGRERMRALGAPSYEWFIASNEATSLLELGGYQEADALVREILGSHRALLAATGVVQSLQTQASIRLHQGSVDEARRLLEETEPMARPHGDALYPVLVFRAELEEASGNFGAARLAIREGMQQLVAGPEAGLWSQFGGLDVAARLMPPDELRPLFEIARRSAASPAGQSRLLEAEGIAIGNRRQILEAAEIYRSRDLPYREARARVAAGDLERAAEIVARLGVEESPVGKALAAARAAAADASDPSPAEARAPGRR